MSNRILVYAINMTTTVRLFAKGLSTQWACISLGCSLKHSISNGSFNILFRIVEKKAVCEHMDISRFMFCSSRWDCPKHQGDLTANIIWYFGDVKPVKKFSPWISNHTTCMSSLHHHKFIFKHTLQHHIYRINFQQIQMQYFSLYSVATLGLWCILIICVLRLSSRLILFPQYGHMCPNGFLCILSIWRLQSFLSLQSIPHNGHWYLADGTPSSWM